MGVSSVADAHTFLRRTVAASHFDSLSPSWVNAMGKEHTGSLRQPGLPKCRQQLFVIRVACETQDKGRHYAADSQAWPLGEAHRRLVRFPQGSCRSRPDDRTLHVRLRQGSILQGLVVICRLEMRGRNVRVAPKFCVSRGLSCRASRQASIASLGRPRAVRHSPNLPRAIEKLGQAAFACSDRILKSPSLGVGPRHRPMRPLVARGKS
jgi:hypothetical protein